MNPPRDHDRVDKVVRLIGTSTSSWEDAARAAVAEAAKTIRDLRLGRVTDLDTRLVSEEHGVTLVYRVLVEVSFQLDRSRTTAGGERIEVRRYLIVGNGTLASAELERIVRARVQRGPCEFHVLVPRVPVPLGNLVLSDPVTGYVAPAELPYTSLQDATVQANERLDEFTSTLAGMNATVTGEVGETNPARAVAQVLNRSTFDEIIVATLPSSISRWLRIDLISRLQRATEVPVTHVETT